MRDATVESGCSTDQSANESKPRPLGRKTVSHSFAERVSIGTERHEMLLQYLGRFLEDTLRISRTMGDSSGQQHPRRSSSPPEDQYNEKTIKLIFSLLSKEARRFLASSPEIRRAFIAELARSGFDLNSAILPHVECVQQRFDAFRAARISVVHRERKGSEAEKNEKAPVSVRKKRDARRGDVKRPGARRGDIPSSDLLNLRETDSR